MVARDAGSPNALPGLVGPTRAEAPCATLPVRRERSWRPIGGSQQADFKDAALAAAQHGFLQLDTHLAVEQGLVGLLLPAERAAAHLLRGGFGVDQGTEALRALRADHGDDAFFAVVGNVFVRHFLEFADEAVQVAVKLPGERRAAGAVGTELAQDVAELGVADLGGEDLDELGIALADEGQAPVLSGRGLGGGRLEADEGCGGGTGAEGSGAGSEEFFAIHAFPFSRRPVVRQRSPPSRKPKNSQSRAGRPEGRAARESRAGGSERSAETRKTAPLRAENKVSREKPTVGRPSLAGRSAGEVYISGATPGLASRGKRRAGSQPGSGVRRLAVEEFPLHHGWF